MDDPHDLADPAFEPTDEQLEQLSVRAFAGVKEANERALEELRARIAVERERVLEALPAAAPERES